MSKVKICAVLVVAVGLYATATASASASWFVEGEELASTAALATTAKVTEEPTLTFSGVTVKCSGSTLNSVKPELLAPNKLTVSSLVFSGCTASGENCTLSGTTIGTLPLTAELTEQTVPEDKATFAPKTGTLFATLKLQGETCAETGKLAVTGKATTLLPTGQEENTTQTIKANTTKTSGELKIGSTAAELTGAAGLELATAKPFAATGERVWWVGTKKLSEWTNMTRAFVVGEKPITQIVKTKGYAIECKKIQVTGGFIRNAEEIEAQFKFKGCGVTSPATGCALQSPEMTFEAEGSLLPASRFDFVPKMTYFTKYEITGGGGCAPKGKYGLKGIIPARLVQPEVRQASHGIKFELDLPSKIRSEKEEGMKPEEEVTISGEISDVKIIEVVGEGGTEWLSMAP